MDDKGTDRPRDHPRLRRIATQQGRSVVIVSHDVWLKTIADRVLSLEGGQSAR